MIMFRAMGVTHIIAGVFLAGASVLQLDASITPAIIYSQLIGGAVMAAIGFKFKI